MSCQLPSLGKEGFWVGPMQNFSLYYLWVLIGSLQELGNPGTDNGTVSTCWTECCKFATSTNYKLQRAAKSNTPNW